MAAMACNATGVERSDWARRLQSFVSDAPTPTDGGRGAKEVKAKGGQTGWRGER